MINFIFLAEDPTLSAGEKVLNFLKEQTGKLISTGIIIALYIILIIILRIITNRIISKKKGKQRRTETLAKLIQSIFKYILAIFGVIFLLRAWGVDVMPLLAGAGIVGIVIGLGAQDLIKDFLAGLSIVFENYYDVGDIVEIKGYKGTVIEIGLKTTKIENWAGELKIFSNRDISEVTNFSRKPTVVAIDFEVSYKENIDKVITLLEEKLPLIKEQYPQVVEGPNILGVDNLGSNGVTIKITIKTLPGEQFSVERGIKKYVKEIFEENNIEIPFNQLVIHNDKN